MKLYNYKANMLVNLNQYKQQQQQQHQHQQNKEEKKICKFSQ